MTSIDQAFFDAVLADIVYVDGITPGMSGNVLRDKIRFRVPLPLAQEIGDRLQVLAVRDDPASEFQGVVFKDLTDGTLYVANRGTAGGKDIPADFDLAAVSGVARFQVAAMVNWWNDIANPANTAYTKVAGVPLADTTDPRTFKPDGSAVSSGLIAAEVAQASAAGKLRVVGHSLGGHLTTIFASLFYDQVSNSSTFNGAGLFSGTAISGLLQGLEIGTPLSQLATIIGKTAQLPDGYTQDNFYAANGLSLTTNDFTFLQLGKRIPIYNEYSSESSFPFIKNHYLYKLTDTLALFRVFEQLDPNAKLATLNALAETGSSAQPSSLESLLDGLRAMLLGAGLAPTPVSDDGGDSDNQIMPADRTAYYANLEALVDAPAFQNVKGKIELISLAARSSDGLAANAKTDFGTFAALRTLAPFALAPKVGIAGSQAALDNLWQTTRGTDYLEWQADKTARLNPDGDTELDFTDPWYADRATMLAWKNQYNRDDGQSPLRSNRIEAYVFEDLAPGTAMSLVVGGRQPASLLNPVKVTFGSDVGETLTGGDAFAGDHLYGMGGADTISGNSGNDYIEGNDAVDTLSGNDGNDTLLGGQGDDFVYGDANDDKLYGSQGDDLLEGGEGRDELRGGTDADILRGGDQNDLLDGGADNDVLNGGTGS
ncbi:MAG TPA: calcium-binding protein, partial [Casimicrobiaceae bacterium]